MFLQKVRMAYLSSYRRKTWSCRSYWYCPSESVQWTTFVCCVGCWTRIVLMDAPWNCSCKCCWLMTLPDTIELIDSLRINFSGRFLSEWFAYSIYFVQLFSCYTGLYACAYQIPIGTILILWYGFLESFSIVTALIMSPLVTNVFFYIKNCPRCSYFSPLERITSQLWGRPNWRLTGHFITKNNIGRGCLFIGLVGGLFSTITLALVCRSYHRTQTRVLLHGC